MRSIISPSQPCHIFLKYQNKVKKLNWRKNLSPEDFAYLIKSIFGFQGKILGFQSSDGTIFEFSYLLKNQAFISNSPYQILVKSEPTPPKLYQNLHEIRDLKQFEDILMKSSKDSMHILGVFTESDQSYDDSLEKLEEFAVEYASIDCSFSWILLGLADRNMAKRTFVMTPPLLAFYTGPQKFLEMPVTNFGLEHVGKLLDRVNFEREASIFDIDQTDRTTVSINSLYIIDEPSGDTEEKSQDTYVLDTRSESTYELKSDRSDRSCETFNIDESASPSENQPIANTKFEAPIQNKPKVIDPKKSLDFKKKDSEDSKGSYFLSKKSTLTPINKSDLAENKFADQANEDIGSLSPSKYTDFYSLLHDNVSKFEPEDYGMAMCLYKEKDRGLFELLNDCRVLNDKDLNSFLISSFARKKFSLWLIDNFSREGIEKISEEKSVKNSGVYTAYQCFKYDNDLEDLKAMLEKVIQNEPKEDHKTLRKPTDSIVENEYSDYIKGVDNEFVRKYTHPDLHIIKEGSAKDEESPTMPGEYPGVASAKKRNEKKYKEMVMALKDQEEKIEESKGFNLILVGEKNGLNGLEDKPSAKGKSQLTIDCAKNEHPLAREVLEKFFEQGEMEKNLDLFYKIKHKLKWTAQESEKLQHLFDQRDPSLLHIVNSLKSQENQLYAFQNEIRDILKVNSFAISSSPRSIKKVQIFNLFKGILEELYRENRINSTQVKLCLYLFMKIEMSILSAFEVFQLTKDREDFLDSLNLIYKINYVKLEQQLDDIEEYDDLTHTQLKIVYAFQADFELSERSTLETVVKAQDRSLLQLHEEYRKTKNKPDFIRKVKRLCSEKAKQLKEFQNLQEEKQNDGARQELKNKRKNLIETCKIHRFLKEIPNITMILEAIENDDRVMESICLVYELTLDKQDFTESVRTFYRLRTKDQVLQLIREIVAEKQWTELDFKIISDAIDAGNKVIMGAYQLYDESKDNDDRLELTDTLEKFIKVQKTK